MRKPLGLVLLCSALTLGNEGRAAIVFEATSAYHHIRIIDEGGIRTLSFDGSMETRMSLGDPLKGHFEYTEYFHMPWLWNGAINKVLMIGLGGGSTQRAFQHYYPDVTIETAEIDPAVFQVAQQFFHVKESPTFKVHLSDGRVYLRRSATQYDVIIMDAYTKGRYGSSIPHHLVTKEFFALASEHLTTNGILAYNVIGSLQGQGADILGAVYKTLKTVFPQVYFFPATDSGNVVVIATKSSRQTTFNELHQRAAVLMARKRVTMPTFRTRVYSFRTEPPISGQRSPVLTDDYAPVDGLLSTTKEPLAR